MDRLFPYQALTRKASCTGHAPLCLVPSLLATSFSAAVKISSNTTFAWACSPREHICCHPQRETHFSRGQAPRVKVQFHSTNMNTALLLTLLTTSPRTASKSFCDTEANGDTLVWYSGLSNLCLAGS